jgi:predicted nucleic acid-binding protein
VNGYLLDTNIPSELVKKQPEPRLVEWLDAQDDESLFLSVVTLGEIRKGFTILPDGNRRRFLEGWYIDELLPWFEGRILPVSAAVAERWGRVRRYPTITRNSAQYRRWDDWRNGLGVWSYPRYPQYQ